MSSVRSLSNLYSSSFLITSFRFTFPSLCSTTWILVCRHCFSVYIFLSSFSFLLFLLSLYLFSFRPISYALDKTTFSVLFSHPACLYSVTAESLSGSSTLHFLLSSTFSCSLILVRLRVLD